MQKRRRRGRGGRPPLRRWSLHRFRHPTHRRSSQKRRKRRKRRTRQLRSCRTLRIRRQGGERVLLPTGSGSWCKRRRRMLSDMDWRRSVVLQQRRRGCLRLLSLRCFGRSLDFQLRRGKVFASLAIKRRFL
jgi:hypothetical protein